MTPDPAGAVFEALADPTRRRVVYELSKDGPTHRDATREADPGHAPGDREALRLPGGGGSRGRHPCRPGEPLRAAHPGASRRRRPGCARSARCGIGASRRSRSTWSRRPRARREGGSDDRFRASGGEQGAAARSPGRDRPSTQGMPPRIRPVPEGAAMTIPKTDEEAMFEPVRKSVHVDRSAEEAFRALHGAHRPMVAGGGPLTGGRRAVRRRRQGGAGRLRASCRWPSLRGHVRGCRRGLG